VQSTVYAYIQCNEQTVITYAPMYI